MRAGGASLSTGGGGGGSFSSQPASRFAGRWSKYSKANKKTPDQRTSKYAASVKKSAPKNNTDVAEIFRKRKDYRNAKYRRGVDPGQDNIGGKDILTPIDPGFGDGGGGGGGNGGGGDEGSGDGKNDSRGAIRRSYWAKVLYPNLKERKRSS